MLFSRLFKRNEDREEVEVFMYSAEDAECFNSRELDKYKDVPKIRVERGGRRSEKEVT